MSKVHSNLVQDLLHDLFPLFLILEPGDIVDRVIHHLLSLVHDVVFLLELHGYSLKRGEVHLPVHAAQQRRCALHRLHHLLVATNSL